MQYTQNQLEEKFNRLPENLKDAMVSVETADTVRNISNKHHLHIDQMGELAEEIGFVMLGVTRPYQFIDNIAKRLRVSQELAKDITRDVNEQIFIKIKDSLQEIQGFKPESVPDATENKPIASNQTQKSEPVATPTPPPRNVFDEKMSSLFKTTKTEEEISDKPSNLDQNTDKEPPRHDPYRESVE